MKTFKDLRKGDDVYILNSELLTIQKVKVTFVRKNESFTEIMFGDYDNDVYNFDNSDKGCPYYADSYISPNKKYIKLEIDKIYNKVLKLSEEVDKL